MIDRLFDHMQARHDDFARCFNLRDADGIADSFYADDATMLPAGRRPIRGRDAIRAFLRELYGVRTQCCTIVVKHVESSDQLAFVIGTYLVETVDGYGTHGTERGSLLETWRCEDGVWWCVADMYVSTMETPE